MTTLLQSLEELQSWDTYRAFLKIQLKLLASGDTFFVSKNKVEFELRGKPWTGYAFLFGKKGEMAVLKLRKEGVLFREGTCTLEGKEIALEGLADTLVRGAGKTLKKLLLGYKIRGGDDEEDAEESASEASASAGGPEEDEMPAAAGAERRAAGTPDAGAEEDEEPAGALGREAEWQRLKRALTPRVQEAARAGTVDGGRVSQLLRRSLESERARDFDGAIEGFEALRALLDRGERAAGGRAGAQAAAQAGAQAGAADGAAGQELARKARRIDQAVGVWRATEAAVTRQLRELQRAVLATGQPVARTVVGALEQIRQRLERIDDEAEAAAEAARSGDAAAFARAEEAFRRKLRTIRTQVESDELIADADANPKVQVRLRETLTRSLDRLGEAV